MAQFEVITYDVWGNARDGFDVNQSFHTGRIAEIPNDASDYQINRILAVQGIEWDGSDEFTLYGTVKRNGRPAMELQRIEQEQ